MRLKGKVAFVTGGGSGIGAVIARTFASQGAMVALAARKVERCEKIAEQIRKAGGEAIAIRMDQSIEEDVLAAVARTAEALGDITVLVNNAGPIDLIQSGNDCPVHDLPTADWDHMLKTGLYGPFWCCKYAIPQMLRAGVGSIVNISSTAAVTGMPNMPGYSSAKGGLSALTRALAIDYGQYRIRANGIISGLVIHEGSANMVDTPQKYNDQKSRHLTELGEAADIALAAVYLASDESKFVTGSHLNVDGGALIKSR